MLTISQFLQPIGNEVKLIPIGDIHLGSPQCNSELLANTIAYIRQSHAYVIGMGDYMEAATQASPGRSAFEQQLSLDCQYRLCLEFLRPIRSRILGLHSGNHEERLRNFADFDLVAQLCADLDCRNLGYSALQVLHVGEQSYRVHSWHGSSGAQFQHTKLAAAAKAKQVSDADIYLMGHVHEIGATVQRRFSVDVDGNRIDRKVVVGITGSFMDYDGGYADMKGLIPGKPGVLKLKLYSDRWDIHVSE